MKLLELRKANFLLFTGQVLPSITRMLVLAFCTIIDGAFIAAFVGPTLWQGQCCLSAEQFGSRRGDYVLQGSARQRPSCPARGKEGAGEVFLFRHCRFGQGSDFDGDHRGIAFAQSCVCWMPQAKSIPIAIRMDWFWCGPALLTILKEALISCLRVDGRPGLSLTSQAMTFIVSALAVFFTRKTYHFLPETHGIRQERLD